MKIIALLFGIALSGIALPGCACWTDQSKMNTPACIIAHDIVDCTTSTIKGALPYFAQIVGSLISGGMSPSNIPWDSIETQAEGMGIKDGGCFLAQLKSLVFGTASGSQETMLNRKALDAVLSDYKLRHFRGAAVKFKIKDKKSGKEVLL